MDLCVAPFPPSFARNARSFGGLRARAACTAERVCSSFHAAALVRVRAVSKEEGEPLWKCVKAFSERSFPPTPSFSASFPRVRQPLHSKQRARNKTRLSSTCVCVCVCVCGRVRVCVCGFLCLQAVYASRACSSHSFPLSRFSLLVALTLSPAR